MKNCLMLAALVAALSCCQPLDRRFDFQNGYSHERNEEGDSGETPQEPAPVVPDTTVWITAVSLPKEYDWRRDSSYYLSSGEILVFKDSVRTLSVPAGRKYHISTSSDMHFMLEGNLFTQYCLSGHTYIGRNGSIVLDYQGEEFIKGLAIQGNDILTLGSVRDIGGFKLRRNGSCIVSQAEGNVWGGLNDPSFPSTGALYQVDSSFYFSWTKGSDWYIYGTDTGRSDNFGLPTGISYLMDLRYADNGTACIGCSYDGSLRYFTDGQSTTIMNSAVGKIGSCRLYSNESGGFAAAIRTVGDGLCSVWKPESRTILSRTSVDYIVSDGNAFAGIRRGSDGTISVSGRNGAMTTLSGKYYLFNNHCVCLCGGSLFMVLTPLEKGRKPVLWKDGEITEINVDGFLSGVYVDLSPAS